MGLLGKWLGTTAAEPAPPPASPAATPLDPSVLEWRRLNELPAPKLRPLPLADDVDAPSPRHPPLKPARIVDELPEGCEGPLYYRIVRSQRGQAVKPRRYVAIDAQGLKLDDQPGQRLCSAWPTHVAQGQETKLFAAPGRLDPIFEVPLPARFLARADKPFPEYTCNIFTLVSSRLRRAIEALEPGAHLFLALDLCPGEEPPLHVFFPGVLFRPTALAIDANGIRENLLPGGGVKFTGPRLSARHFYRLNRNVIGAAEIFVDPWLGPIFSQRAVAQFGDVLEREHAFMPMGVCEEPIEPGASKATRDGSVHPL